MAGAPPPPSQSQPLSAEEEALKSSMDCVYFLASPLTCKKGSECEYRHSDVARINPRDCWFWVHGNCLNPRCSFRHPPFDGLPGTQTTTSAGPSVPVTHAPVTHVPATQPAITPTPHVTPHASAKQGVPCIFFQKGHCVKGDWCHFLHVPNSLNNKASTVPGTSSAAEPATLKKAFSGVEKPVQEKKVVLPASVPKPVKDSIRANPTVEVEAPPRNEFSVNRRAPQTSSHNDFPRYRTTPPVSNGTPVSWSNRVQPPHLLDEPESMNSKEAEEVSREPSPGFDVLVDDEGRDSDYYPGEDRYGMPREHESRNEYDMGHSIDYNAIAALDDDRYQDPVGYNSHDHHKGQYGWDPRRASSERMSGGSYHERRPHARRDNVSQVDELDLRHRLAKQKRQNGLRSVISHEHARDMEVRDRSYHGSSHRDEKHYSLNETSLSSRLRGRIRMPGRSISPNERDMVRGGDRSRRSPVRASISPYKAGIRDKIQSRVGEAFNNGGRNNYTGQHMRRDFAGDNNKADFAPPKSLAELKNRKNAEPSRRHLSDQQSLGKRKHSILDVEHQQIGGGGVSFEGPKPLQEILKRKRGERSGIAEEEGIITDDKNVEEVADKIDKEESSPAEEGILVEDGVNLEAEVYEPREGESDYEHVDGEDYELYDGENGEDEGEYPDEEDDGDEFAKKMGVMY
ncbi:hypothetical protein ABFS82_05G055300 [Erythranthe guttata]